MRAEWLAGGFGLLIGGAAVLVATGSSGNAAEGQVDRTQIEAVVRDYILAHPEIIPQAMAKLQDRETSKLLAANRKALETPFAGAWAGANDGDVRLVMFTDYSCGYCRASVPDVDRLIAEDGKLTVIWRELPILGPGSEQAARAALAAAKQGRYLGFHRGMFAAGPPTAVKVSATGKAAGLDAAKLAMDTKDQAITDEIDTNIELARTLGVTGTPSFVIGDRMLSGAVGYEELKKAVAEARAKKG